MEQTLIAQGPVDVNVMPSEANALLVEFFHQAGDEPFICGVSGHATVEGLAKIEAECKAEADDIFEQGDGSYLFEARWFSGQYGEYGQCELPPCWELSLQAFEPADEPMHNL